jgi:hypothetical protein
MWRRLLHPPLHGLRFLQNLERDGMLARQSVPQDAG